MSKTKTVPVKPKQYQITKAQCESRISGVCEGCGGELTAIETVDNSGNPTFWPGCERCGCFRAGIAPKYVAIARELVEKEIILPYHHLDKYDYNKKPEQREYYLQAQTAGLSYKIKQIEAMLAAAPPADERECEWALLKTKGVAYAYQASCVPELRPMRDGKFCPYCGGKVRVRDG